MHTQFHDVANIFPMMSADEFAALAEDIRANGQREPIYTYQGKIIDGRNRYNACMQIGATPIMREWDGAGSLVAFVVSLNLQRRHLSPSQKATVAVDILPMLEAEAKERRIATQGRPSDSGKLRQIFDTDKTEYMGGILERSRDDGRAAEQAAQIVGTNRQYVHDAKRLKEESPALFERVRSSDVPINIAADVSKKTPGAVREFIEKVDSGIKPAESFRQVSHQLLNSSKSNEYYTPLEFLDSAREVMGGIDLDPASCKEANENVKAKRFYTIDDDGFRKPWKGRVWMNPPYGKDEGETEGNQARWVRKICDEYKAGNVTEAMVLVNAVPGNKWFHPLWEHTICFTYRRIQFINSTAPTHSNVIVYLGDNVKRFVEVFSKHGAVVRRLNADEL